MIKKFLSVVFVLILFFSRGAFAATLEERVRILEEKAAKNEELEQKVALLTQENQTLKSKLNVLEKNNKEPLSEKPAPIAIPETIKFKGRLSAGFFKQANGNAAYNPAPPYSHGSFEVPDAKAQMSVAMDEKNSAVLRANLNNATWNSLDLLYVDSKIGTLIPHYEDLPLTMESRVGRFKMPFGEEMYTNDPIDSATTDNSAMNLFGYDQGFQLSGDLGKLKNPIKYWFSVTNGQGSGSTTGTTHDNYFPKAFTARVAYQVSEPFYVSGSVYTSGGLGSGACNMSFAGLSQAPLGASGWKRNLWELDARYDLGKKKKFSADAQGAYTDSKAYIRAAFGELYDVSDGAISDRDADYGLLEGLWNFHPKFYGAARFSVIQMKDGASAALNSLQYAKNYDRYSLALGYRFSSETILRLAYQINVADLAPNPVAADEANDNQIMLTLGTIF